MASNSVNGQPDIANITVIADERQVAVPYPIVNVVEVNNPGPQGIVGPQGEQGPSGSTQPFSNVSGNIWATTSSLQVTGSFTVSGSSTFTNIGPAVFSGSTSLVGATTMSSAVVSGNVQVLGTASINVLQINTTINSTGSNTLGDNTNDTQTLYGTVVIPTGSLTVSGSTQINDSLTIKRSTAGQLIEFRNQSPFAYQDNIIVGGIQHTSEGGLLILGGPGNQYFNNSVGIGIVPNTITFNTAGTGEKMRITGSGNVLIGTTTDAGYKLNVRGEAIISSSLTLDSQPIFRVMNGFGANIVDARGNGNFVLGGSSDLGIGTGLGIFTRYSLRVGSLSYSDASAILQADSTTRGFLPPRTNSTASISSPAQGLMTYLTGSTNEGLYYYNSGSQIGWHRLLTNTGSQSITGSLTTIGTVDITGASIFRGQVQTTTGFYSSGTGTGLNFYGGTTGVSNAFIFNAYGSTSDISSHNFVNISRTFDPTSGTGVYNTLLLGPTVNQTGGANGITRGLYVNPTLTSAADFRSIETTAGNVLFQSGSTPLMFVSSSGRVGIGTSTPTKRLEVYDAASGDGLSVVRSSVTTQRIELIPNDSTVSTLIKGGGNGKPFYIASWANGGTAQPLYFGTNYANGIDEVRMTIDTTGSVGIGTITPTAKLHITGSSNSGLLEIDSPTLNNILYVSGSGNVGISTSSPLVSLDIRATNNSAITPLSVVPNNATTLLVGNTGTNAVLSFGQNNTGAGWIQGRSRLGDGSSFPILLNPLGGNVLIGTTTDSGYKLEVSGSTRLNGNTQITGSLNISGSLEAKVNSASTTNNALKLSNTQGNASIGTGLVFYSDTTPSQGTFNTGRIYSDFPGFLYTDARMIFQTPTAADTWVDAMTLKNGNVGIGTTAPSTKLHISGSSNSGLLEIDSSAVNNILYVSGSGVIGFNQTSSLNSQATFKGVGGNSYTSEINTLANGQYGFRTDGSAKAANWFLYNSTGNISNLSGVSLIYFDASNNIGIGVSSSLTAKTTIRGTGVTNSTTALRVENTNASASMVVLDNGYVGINTGSAQYNLDVNGTARISGNVDIKSVSAPTIVTLGGFNELPAIRLINTNNVISVDANNVMNFAVGNGVKANHLLIYGNSNLPNTSTTGVANGIAANIGFAPTSGSASFNLLNLSNTINQTGGANGITRGLYINPTLTAAADFRAIETTSGSVIFNHGATTLMSISSSGNIGINTTASSAYNLDVNGTARVKGVGTTSATFPFTVQNASNVELFKVLDNGAIYIPTSALYLNNIQGYSTDRIQTARLISGNPVGAMNASAQLEIVSTTTGFLPPRMTNAQRLAISTPAVGLIVYCTDATEGLYIYKSTGWTFIV